MPLSDAALRSLKKREQQYRIADEKGLYVIVSTSGSRLWRFDYRFAGRRLTLALGKYPEVSLSDARSKRDDARSLIAKGVNPSEFRGEVREGKTFEDYADEHLTLLEGRGQAEATLAKNTWMLKKLAADLLPKSMAAITSTDILNVLRQVELSGRRESAVRLRSTISSVFSLAIIAGEVDNDPSFPLRRALAMPVVKHHAAVVEPRKIGRLLDDIEQYDGWPTIRAALLFSLYTFPRPGSVRAATWEEVDFEDAVWRIPKEHMKRITGRPPLPHDIPLSLPAVRVLRDIKRLTGKGPLIFPSIRSAERPLSENALNSALRRMGYTKDQHTAHGFRTTASTRLHDDGRFRGEVIEFQLAHIDPNKVKGAYNRAEYWDERVVLMDEWAKLLAGYRKL